MLFGYVEEENKKMWFKMKHKTISCGKKKIKKISKKLLTKGKSDGNIIFAAEASSKKKK